MLDPAKVRAFMSYYTLVYLGLQQITMLGNLKLERSVAGFCVTLCFDSFIESFIGFKQALPARGDERVGVGVGAVLMLTTSRTATSRIAYEHLYKTSMNLITFHQRCNNRKTKT